MQLCPRLVFLIFISFLSYILLQSVTGDASSFGNQFVRFHKTYPICTELREFHNAHTRESRPGCGEPLLTLQCVMWKNKLSLGR